MNRYFFLPSYHTADDEEARIPNIIPGERLKRLISGVFPFVMGPAILACLISTSADHLWRHPLYFLFVVAASNFFQWRDKT